MYKAKYILPLPFSSDLILHYSSLIPSPHFSHAVFASTVYFAYDTLHTGVGRICSLLSFRTLLECHILSKAFRDRESQLSSRDSCSKFTQQSCGCLVRLNYSDPSHLTVPRCYTLSNRQWRLDGYDIGHFQANFLILYPALLPCLEDECLPSKVTLEVTC